MNPGTVTLQEASLGRRIVAISIPRTNREYNTILLDCVSHYNTIITVRTKPMITIHTLDSSCPSHSEEQNILIILIR